VSEGYQSTGQKEFWFFATLLLIIGVGMAVSSMVGKYTNSVWIVVAFGLTTGSVFRWLSYKMNRLGTAPDEQYLGWKKYFNSPLIAVFGFGFLATLNIFNPFSNSASQPDYIRAFFGGIWLLFACDQCRLWYKNRKVN
jgi:hypothetical protein